jgi:DNA-binding NtrC family response regulator
MDAALLYDWRGNLRELRNFVTRTIIMRDPDGGIRELESKIAAMNESAGQDRAANEPYHCPAMRSFVRDVKDRTEVQMIRDALEVSGWNRRRAAKYLDISYRGLLYKIQQHRLTPGVPKDLNEAIRRSYSARGDTAA